MKKQIITKTKTREKYYFHKNNVHFDDFYERLVENNFFTGDPDRLRILGPILVARLNELRGVKA